DDFLSSHLVLLKDPFQLPHTGQRFCVLQRIDDQQDVMVNDRLICSRGEPGTRPGWKAFDFRLGETTEAVMKKAMEARLLFFGKHGLALGQNGQPDRESVCQSLQWWGQSAAITMPE